MQLVQEQKRPPLAARIAHDVLGVVGAATVLYLAYRLVMHLG